MSCSILIKKNQQVHYWVIIFLSRPTEPALNSVRFVNSTYRRQRLFPPQSWNGEGQEWLEAARAFKQSSYRSARLSKKQALLLLIAIAVTVCDKILLCKCGWGLVPPSLGGQTAHTPVASLMMPPASDVIVFSFSWQESPDARLLLKQSRQSEMTATER